MNNMIDEKFHTCGDKPSGNTVGELIDILLELPRELDICQDYPHVGFSVTVYNVKQDNIHVGIDDICDC